MKKINNTKSEVFLSTYDNSDLLLPVSEEYKNNDNICVAVKFSDILIKISPNNTCKCSWNMAMEKHRDKLSNPAYWQMVGSVCYKVNQAIEMLGHDQIGYVWTDTEDDHPRSSDLFAWNYYGPYGSMNTNNKLNSFSVRAAKVYKID